jgi:transposase
VDDAGHVEHLELPQRISGGLQKVADLESIRDKSFNEARARLVAWLIVNGATAPQWLKDETKTIGQWRSIDRLIRLTQRWKRERFAGDADGFRDLEAWRYNDHHLWRWQEDQRINSIRARREIYRCFAARLCERYATVYVDDFDLRTVAEKRPIEAEPQTEFVGARANRQLAAVSILRGAIDNAAPSRGTFVVEVETGHDTRTCADCGHEENWDAAKSINHICPACGVVWDQDVNAARNVLRRGEQLGDVAQLRAARALELLEKKSRWAKVRERVAEKKRSRSQTDP